MAVQRGVAGSVKVTGMREARAALKRCEDADRQSELRSTNVEVAELIVTEGRQRAAGVSALAAKAARTLRAGRALTRATVTLGGASAPFALGAEFGAFRNQRRFNVGGNPPRHGQGWNQFAGWRGNHEDAGYFMYPSIRENTDRIVDMYGDAIERIFGGSH